MDRTTATPPVRTELLDGVSNVEVRYLDFSNMWQLDWPPVGMAGHAAPHRAPARRGVRDRAQGLRPRLAARGDDGMTPRSRQRGVAVLIAMLAVTVGTILAVNLMWQGTLDLRRAESALATDQGMLYMQGAEAWAADILHQDLIDSPQSDNLSEIWATELPPLPVDGGTIQGKLEDLQGRFNLNSLIDTRGRPDPIALKQFERLLTLLEIDPQLAGGVLDWLDRTPRSGFRTAARTRPTRRPPRPHRTANMPITSPSELMAVSGFDRKIYATLAPYVTALPSGTKLNVNTAAPIIIASLSDMIDAPPPRLSSRHAATESSSTSRTRSRISSTRTC
jgi:general secretion pathway protein K